MTEDELKEENAELHADYEALADENTKLRDQNARLKAEVERLTALVESNLNSYKVAMGKADAVLHELDSLKAEVERLRKAGDAMAKTIGENGVSNKGSFHDVADSIDRWNAAKEGKQS